jgi:hypothetical protein
VLAVLQPPDKQVGLPGIGFGRDVQRAKTVEPCAVEREADGFDAGSDRGGASLQRRGPFASAFEDQRRAAIGPLGRLSEESAPDVVEFPVPLENISRAALGLPYCIHWAAGR